MLRDLLSISWLGEVELEAAHLNVSVVYYFLDMAEKHHESWPAIIANTAHATPLIINVNSGFVWFRMVSSRFIHDCMASGYIWILSGYTWVYIDDHGRPMTVMDGLSCIVFNDIFG